MRQILTQPLTDEDVAALDGYGVALARLREILQIARHTVNASRPSEDGDWSKNVDFWEVVSGGQKFRTKTWFDWYGETDGHRIDPTGRWTIGAGATWELADAPSETTHAEWFDRRYEESFELGASRNQIHLSRYLSLFDLAKHPTLDDQASALASWALETWELLDADPC